MAELAPVAAVLFSFVFGLKWFFKKGKPLFLQSITMAMASHAFGTGLMHGMCTLLVGVGISFVKKRRKLFAVGTFGLLSTAIVYHGIYNILIQSEYSMVGALLPIVTYMPFFVWRLRLKQRQAQEGKNQ